MTRYEDLDEQGQVATVTEAAHLALPLLGIDARHVGLVAHAYNSTFAVDLVAGGRVAVRVLVNSIADDAHVRGQLAWAQALAVAGVPVPPPWFGPGGEDVVVVRPLGATRDFRVCASWWVEGEVHEELSADGAFALGSVMARMHHQAERWSLPEGTAFPLMTDPFCGYPDIVTPALGTDGDRAVVAEAVRRAQAAVDAANAIGVLPVHSDLHAGNLMWVAGRAEPYVLDLDDAVVASPAHDLAVTSFYTRRASDPDVMPRFFAGYTSQSPLPPVDSTTFEGLLASRQLCLTASLLDTVTPSFRSEAESYLGTTVARLRHYLDEGVLDPRIVADEQPSG